MTDASPLTDASVPADADLPMADGSTEDAGMTSDASIDDAASKGCGCVVVGKDDASASTWLALLALMAIVTLRRARTRA